MIMAAELEELGVSWCFSQILHNLSICFFFTYAGNPDDMMVLTNHRERWQAFVHIWLLKKRNCISYGQHRCIQIFLLTTQNAFWSLNGCIEYFWILPLYFRLDFVHQKIYRGLSVDMACKKLYVVVVGMLLWRRKKREEKNSNKYKSLHFKIGG